MQYIFSKKNIKVIALLITIIFSGNLSYGVGNDDIAKVRHPYTLTISGAVSLGSYEAGFVYYLLRMVQQYSSDQYIHAITGASAGSVNGWISSIYVCNPLPENPQDSLYWKSWINIGIKELFDKNEVTTEAFFNRRILNQTIAPVEEAWMKGWEKGCGVTLGVTVTRKDPLLMEPVPGMPLSRTLESFSIRIEGNGVGRAPKLSNVFRGGALQVALPFNGDAHHDFALLHDVVFASMAFPLAFPAQTIKYCLVKNEAEMNACNDAGAKTDEFVDGGIQDTSPVRLALDLFRKDPNLSSSVKERVRHVLVDPDPLSYPEYAATEHAAENKSGAFSLLGMLMGGFFSSSRTSQLNEFVSSQPDIQGRLKVNTKDVPLTGRYMSAFSGFIETDFRRFDFMAGMNDARRMLGEYTKDNPRLQEIQKKDEQISLGMQKSPDWQHYLCLKEAVDNFAGDGSACTQVRASKETADKNFLILLQASLDILNARCKDIKDSWIQQPLCRNFSQRNGPTPWFLGNDIKPAEPKDLTKSDFDMFFTLLEQYKFTFTDLGLTAEEAHLGKERLRAVLNDFVSQWANFQPGTEKFFISWGARLGLDAITYGAPYRYSQFLLGNGAEFWQSHMIRSTEGQWSTLRLGYGLQFRDFATLWTRDSNRVAFIPMVGPEWQPYALNSKKFQTRIGVRGGYQLASADDYGSSTCDAALSSRTSAACSSWVVGGGATFSLYELLVFQTMVHFYPGAPTGMDKGPDFIIMAGVEFGKP